MQGGWGGDEGSGMTGNKYRGGQEVRPAETDPPYPAESLLWALVMLFIMTHRKTLNFSSRSTYIPVHAQLNESPQNSNYHATCDVPWHFLFYSISLKIAGLNPLI